MYFYVQFYSLFNSKAFRPTPHQYSETSNQAFSIHGVFIRNLYLRDSKRNIYHIKAIDLYPYMFFTLFVSCIMEIAAPRHLVSTWNQFIKYVIN